MKKQRSMLEGSPLKSIILFALPIMASSLLQYNYSLVDNIIVGRYVSEQALAAAKRYILAIAQCYSLVAILFVMRNTLQGMGFTYANSVAGIGEFFGRLSVAFVLTPLLGFDAVCYAGPAAWLLADIPLIIIYLVKQRQFGRLEAKKAS